jgi:tRNA pseudouridine55 synthase
MKSDLSGIICVDKPAGITSFDVVSRLRHILAERRIGHAGTLDPMATGVLPVFIGRATRAISLLPIQDKSYTATFRLGITTDTGDITGHVLTQSEVNVGRAQLKEAIVAFKGEIMQVPPMYSAIKKDGKRLYQLARKGIEVERESRPIVIYSIELLDTCENNEYTINVSCSKGTYIRTLCEDIGKKLGCGATLSALRRTAAAGFNLESALTLEKLDALKEEGTVSGCILNVEEPFMSLSEINVTDKQAIRFSNGGALSLSRIDDAPAEGLCRVKYNKTFLGLGLIDNATQELLVKCLFTGGITDEDNLL